MPDIPAFDAAPVSGVRPPSTSYDPSYNPFNVSSVPPSQYSPSSYQKQHVEWEPLFQGLEKKGSSSWDMPASPIPDETC